MDYEQKYKEALLRARVVNPGTKDYNIVTTIFPELKKSEDDIFKELFYNLIVANACTPSSKEIFSIYGKTKEDCLAWLEKQNVSTSIKDTSKPKFKVGDWVVYSFTDQIYQVNQIVEAKQLDDETWGYTLEDGSFFSGSWENSYRLWTIQDAKDGDVLATKDAVFIFKHMDKVGLSLCRSYCEVIGNSKLGLGFDFSINGIHPANNEQRNFLFQKMKEEGYKYDTEKKELRKIESESTRNV